ncbi:MAG: MmcB family DNA repair protein [Bacillota bacterium]
MILEALRRRHHQETFITEVKTGPTMYAERGSLQKIDALAIKPSWANPCFTAYEVKVSRSDFLADDKWSNYLNYCHRFYWACPSGLIKPEEVADECGLVWVNEDGDLSVRKAALYRNIEIPWEMLYYILISRIDPDRHPFFNTTREYFEAYLQDKHDKYLLGDMVSRKWRADLEAVKQRVTEAEEIRRRAAVALEVMEVLKEFGIEVSSWNGTASRYDLDRLRERLSSGISHPTVYKLQRAAEYLRDALGELSSTSPEAKEAQAS